MTELIEQVAGLEATMAEMATIQTTYHDSVDQMAANVIKLEGELKDIRKEVGASDHRTPSDRKDKANVTRMTGFVKMKIFTGEASQWKYWRFKMTTWLAQTNPSFETLLGKLDQSELEPQEPEEGQKMKAGLTELTTEEAWCSEQLYQLSVQKCGGPALEIVRNQNTHGKTRGLVAWYRTLRNAEGQVGTKRSEITEKVFYSGRKAVAAKDVVATIETWEGEFREYTSLTGLAGDNALKLLNLKRMLPEAIRKMLQTVELTDYTDAKEYAMKQARVLQKEKDPKHTPLDLNEDEEETG